MRDARRGRRVNLIVYFLLRGDGVEGSREARDGFSVFLSPSRIFFAGTVYCYARRVGISALRTVASNAAAAIAAHNTLVLRSAAAANRIVMGAFPHHVAGDAPAHLLQHLERGGEDGVVVEAKVVAQPQNVREAP